MNMKQRYNVKSVHRYQRRGNGSHEHCCVPLCSNSSRYNSVLSFHRFPRDPELRLKWLDNIRRDCLTATSHIKVCSRHFSSDKICTTTQGRRTLKVGAIPTLFQWNNYMETQSRPNTPPTQPDIEEPADIIQPIDEEVVPVVMDHDYCVPSSSVVVDREHYDSMLRGIGALDQLQVPHLKDPCWLQRFAGSPEDILFYTRFRSYDHLMAFWTLMEPAASGMVCATRAKGASAVREEAFSRSTKLPPIDEFFLFLNYLSTGCTQRELGHRFNIHPTAVSRIILTWADFLYCFLGSVCTWLTPETIRAHLPHEFRDYADTQVIIDCTELRCQTPSSMLLQNEVFSPYESHCTFKAVVGIAPHGAVTFVSALYEGSMSDKEIFRQSGIIPLLSSDMAVMLDKGFLVDDLVPGKVHRPAFLSKGNQMSVHDVVGTQSTARLRVHVEKLMRRVKENKLFDTEIPLSISGSISHLFTVACLLSNYQNAPLVKK